MNRGLLIAILLVLTIIVAIILANRSSSTSTVVTPTPTTSVSPTQKSSVSIINFSFSPSSSSITAGTTVVWTNNDSTPHTVTSDNNLFDSGPLQPGQSFSFTFNQAGSFSYHCSIHPNMHGTILVAQ